MQSIRSLVIMACVAGMAGCRDGVDVYQPPVTELTGSARQLTFNDHPDYTPSWSADSDSVYYGSGDFVSFNAYARTLLRVSVRGGRATALAPEAQGIGFGGAPQPPLAAPVLSPGGGRLAYLQLFCHDSSRETGDSPYNCVNRFALLDSAVVRVRPAGARNAAFSDPGVTVRQGGLDGLVFRPTWSPDGASLSFATDAGIQLWNPTTGALQLIPGTAGAASAAWRPTGGAIAFTRGVAVGEVLVVELGSGTVRSLGAGSEPAWSPDGGTIYFRGPVGIMRMPQQGGSPELVAGTIGGRSPAVSPDGQWLAFTRTKNIAGSIDFDVWVVELD